jgi:hypothetical protein
MKKARWELANKKKIFNFEREGKTAKLLPIT